MIDNNRDPFARGGKQPADNEIPLTEPERRFIERWTRAFPNYRYEQSDFAKKAKKDGEARP
jgi:hypothetical protein